MAPKEGRSVTDYIWSSQKLNWNSKQKYKRELHAIVNRDFLSVILLTCESDKSACLQRWPEDECCYLGFSHTVHLSQSPAHSTIRLTSALHIFSTLPVPTLIPPLPQIQHNQCFIWPWLNPVCFHLLEKAWVTILRGAHPINLSCQSWDFSTDVWCSFARRVWAKKESLLSSEKDGKSFCLEKRRVYYNYSPSQTTSGSKSCRS